MGIPVDVALRKLKLEGTNFSKNDEGISLIIISLRNLRREVHNFLVSKEKRFRPTNHEKLARSITSKTTLINPTMISARSRGHRDESGESCGCEAHGEAKEPLEKGKALIQNRRNFRHQTRTRFEATTK